MLFASFALGETALHEVAESGNAAAERQTDEGAAVNAKDNDGYTPLCRAEEVRYDAVVELLRNHARIRRVRACEFADLQSRLRYMTIVNSGTAADKLTGASSEIATRIEIHDIKENEDGVVQMVQVDGGVGLPPGETVQFNRGELHSMLMGLKRSLSEGKAPILF